MDLFLRTSVFLLISIGFLSLSGKSEACPGNGFPALCEFVFRNVCFDFVGGSNTWSKAKSSCEHRGGELLQMLNKPNKIFLKNIQSKRNFSSFTFWLGKGVQGKALKPIISKSSYAALIELFFCSHSKQTFSSWILIVLIYCFVCYH
uniref:C-type lectin domain-containing protein n=1 Tax=Labrus bergylta TaxID=56723 RepID=A0A3Q3E9F7_9LABR